MSRRQALAGVVVAGGVVLAGCGGEQSALHGHGTRSAAINDNTLLMVVLGSIVWIVVTVLAVLAMVRRRRRSDQPLRRSSELLVVGIGGVALPAVIIIVVTAHAISTLQSIDHRDGRDGLVIEVTGHQFWWDVRYPEHDVVTANEIHIPTGERVQLKLASADVVHSFWLPALTGKMDMIPGTTNDTWVETERPGTYWGQCAEFCGVQHAKMRFVVIAHPPEEFDGWLQAQAEPAVGTMTDEQEQVDPVVAEGREVFMSSSCVYCHTIAGTEAQGQTGPDLTHFASRQTIAAGILPNERGQLAGWIVDPQSTKPGALMPGTDLRGDELQALLTYLESLR